MSVDPVLGPFLVGFALCLGAVLGSFLNVVIARVPEGRSIAWPGSRCPRCGADIRWYDNIPVLSWIVLRGRCRRCRGPISLRYPVVELLGAAAAVAAVLRHGPTLGAVAELAYVLLLLALAFIDAATWLLPHALTWPLAVLGLAAAPFGLGLAPGFTSAVLGATIGFGVFALITFGSEKLFKREALGLGDAFLLAGLGAWSGIAGLLPVVLLASLQGSVIGLILIAAGRAQPGRQEPPPAAGGEPAAEASPASGVAPPPAAGQTTPAAEQTTPAAPAGDAAAAPASDAPVAADAAPDDAAAADDDWVPPRHALPFGPFLVAAALEWLYLAAPLGRAVPALELFR